MILSFSHVKWPNSITEIRGDDESAQKLRGKATKSWLVKFPGETVLLDGLHHDLPVALQLGGGALKRQASYTQHNFIHHHQ